MEIDIKEILYSTIAKMGRGRIESTIISDPSQIPLIIKEICSQCIAILNSQTTDYDKPKIHSDLIEALMHYLLTLTQIPSERKVKYDNDIEINLVIPNLKQLKADPQRTLVISFPKSLDADYINKLENTLLKVQPQKDNIWLVFGYYNNIIADVCKGFTVFVHDDLVQSPFKSLSSIINEIKLFVKANKIKSFKIFRS